MTINPFKYGVIVKGDMFVNRVKETSMLTTSLISGQNLILYSPRRYGKTSLVLKVLDDLIAQGYKTVYIDFFKVYSTLKFLELYYEAIFKNLHGWEKAVKTLSSLAKSVRPLLSMDSTGNPSVSLEMNSFDVDKSFDEILNLPEKLAEKQRWIVVFDEFQEIENLNGESFEKALRSVLQHHQNVSYILMGSKKQLLLNMVTHKNRAFYNFGKLIKLDKIREDEWISYLGKAFYSSNISYTIDNLKEIVHKTDNIPYYVQYLASEIWDLAIHIGSIDSTIIDRAIQQLLYNQNDYFLNIWQNLNINQQKVIKGLAQQNTDIFSKEYHEKFKLGSMSSTQRSVEKLINESIIDKENTDYYFEDPFLKIWINSI